MTREEIIDGLEIYTVGRLKKARVHITVEELQKFIDAIKSLEQEPCDDCISRQDLDKALYECFHEEDSPNNITDVCLGSVRNFIKNFPSVTPQPKMRHWIQVDSDKCKCDQCDVISFIAMYPNGDKNYCPNCGARMVEPQESEE